MVKIEDEENVMRELEQQRTSKANMYFLLAGAFMIVAIAFVVIMKGIGLFAMISLLASSTFFLRGRRIKHKPIFTNRQERLNQGPFKRKW